MGRCLDLMQFDGRGRWNMVELAFWMFFRGKFAGVRGVVLTFAPFLFIAVCVLLLLFAA